MRFKKNKQDVMEDIKWQVHAEVQSILNGYSYNGQMTLNNLMEAIKSAVATGVAKGFEVALENQYTDEDFERDMTLTE